MAKQKVQVHGAQILWNEAFFETLKKSDFCSSSRKAIILTAGIHGVCRGLKFELDTEIEQKAVFYEAIIGLFPACVY